MGMKPPNSRMPGISAGLVAVIIVVVAVAGAGGYYVLKGAGSSSSSLRSSSSSSFSSSTSAGTFQTITSSGNTSGLEDFRGTFHWTSISNSSFEGKPLDTAEIAPGSFTVTINLTNDTGQGSGQGQVPFEWSGKCTGQNSSGYVFTVTADLLPAATGTNLTIFFGPANPSASTLVRTCQGFSSSMESWTWVAVGSPYSISITDGQTIEGTNSFDFGDVMYEITLLQN